MAILIGAATGAAVFALCAYVYRKGVKDGIKRKEKSRKPFEDSGVETENELFRKYAALLNYDPYGAVQKASVSFGSEGGRI